jgi:hypothetical protein
MYNCSKVVPFDSARGLVLINMILIGLNETVYGNLYTVWFEFHFYEKVP